MTRIYDPEQEKHYYVLDDGYCSFSTGPDQALTSALYQLLMDPDRTMAMVYSEREYELNPGETRKAKRLLATITVNPEIPFDPAPFNVVYQPVK